jgi:hypothetical protein
MGTNELEALIEKHRDVGEDHHPCNRKYGAASGVVLL